MPTLTDEKRRKSAEDGRRRSRTGKVDSRVSQGAGQVLMGKGGLGYIARRGVDFGTSVLLQSLDGVGRLATQQPLELLSLLPDVVPEIGLATWNGLRLGCGPGAVRIKAMTVKKGGGSEEAPDGTAAIDALFESLPDEVGSFTDALSKNFLMVLFAGMCALEAVPGPRGTGIAEIWPINSLTLRFKREDTGKLALYQRQTANPNGLGVYSAGFGGLYEPLPMERVFYASIDGFPDDPYGRAPFAPALTETLRMLSFINGLTLAWKRIGMPKLDIGFDFEAMGRYAKDVCGLTDAEEIDDFVSGKFTEAQGFFADLNEDDAYFHPVTDKVNVVGSGQKMPDVQAVFDILRWRLIIALKQNPVLMGFVNGSTETWSDVQWEIYSKGTAALVAKAAQPLVRAASLHLQLLGMPYVAKAEFEPIRSIQRKEDADAEKIEIENAARMRDEGWIDQNTAAMKLTGSAPVNPTPRSWMGVPTAPMVTVAEME